MMIGVDKLGTEFGMLQVRQRAQGQHSPPDALARLQHTHGEVRLAQQIRRIQTSQPSPKHDAVVSLVMAIAHSLTRLVV
jgi:hypothetical protein